MGNVTIPVLDSGGALVFAYSTNSKLSRNAGVHVTVTGEATCPPDCAMWEACYGKLGHVVFQTKRANLSTGDSDVDQIAAKEAAGIDLLPGGQPLRLKVHGDTRTEKGARLLAAAAGRFLDRGGIAVWTFTHVRDIVREAYGRISVLRSCETPAQVQTAWEEGYGAAIIIDRSALPIFNEGRTFGYHGIDVIPCPNQTRGVKCVDCKLCWKDQWLRSTKKAIGFKGHGRTNKVYAIVRRAMQAGGYIA